MAQCKLSPQDFIKNAFTPQIAVLCGSSVDTICQKNNLNFVELVQPFCKLSADVSLQDASGGSTTIHNLRVRLTDVNFRPPQPTLARKYLNASVRLVPELKNQLRTQSLQVGDYALDVPLSTPWFEAWREMFLQVQFPSDHEFTKHFLACMLVVSSADPNPADSMNHLNQVLNQLQNNLPNKLPKWFSSPVLRYYVLVHDSTDGDSSKAVQSLEALKVSFGISNCFLLKINSRPPGQVDEQLPDPWSQFASNRFESTEGVRPSPDNSPCASRSLSTSLEIGQELLDSGNILPYHPLSPDTEAQTMREALLEQELQIDSPVCNILHGMCLTTEDVEQIKLLIHEFCTRALLPYVERHIHSLTEFVSNKKGVSKSLFSATKRWFTPNKVGSGSGSTNMPVYASDAPEIQMRKLGDLYFMFCHYTMAFQVYHAAKRDFNSDQAWFYYAGALEMAGLAAFMANECTRKTCDYIEEGIVTYLNVCKMAQFATRATLLSSECLKGRNLHGEAAHQLIRMTSEESDLRSALLLEQAAYCFLNCNRTPMVRKYAFHMVLAGHRFSKAAQKRHALRCYKQALEVYQNKGWTFAEDHVHYTIGKLSTVLNVLDEAAESFSMLLTIQSKQSIEQQTLFLKEYLLIQRMLVESEDCQKIPILLLPMLQSEFTKILVGPTPPLSIPGKVRALGVSFNTRDDPATMQKWIKLEEMVVHEAQGSLPLLFKPVVTLYTKNNINNTNLIAIVSEPIQVSLKLHNPLSVALNLKNVYLLWSFKGEGANVITNECSDNNLDNFLKTHVIKSLVIQASSSQKVVLSVIPLVVGELLLTGISYNILSIDGVEDDTAIAGKQIFDVKKLGYTKKETSDESQQDVGLPICIMPPAPCLQVTFGEINLEMLSNQLQPISMEMRNVGSRALTKVFLATSSPQCLSSCEFRDRTYKFKEIVDSDIPPALRDRMARRYHVTEVVLPTGSLEPGHTHSVNIWLKAPNYRGSVRVDLLIYYENCSTFSVPRYRLIRHVWNLTVQESIQFDIAITESCKSAEVKELLFSVKAVNLNKHYHSTLTEITILKVGLFSSCWKLKLLENIKHDYSLTVQSQQSAYILLKGLRRITKSSKYYEVVLMDRPQTANNLAYIDFAKGVEQNRINFFEDTVIPNQLLKEGILFFQWKALITDASKNKHTAIGQSAVTIENTKKEEEIDDGYEGPIVLYDPNQSVEMQTSKIENGINLEELRSQISMCIIHSSNICHNFQANKICIIPIKLTVHNDSHVTSLITVNTSETNSSHPPTQRYQRPNLFYPYPSKDYRWVGFSGTMKTVAPLDSEVIMLYVAVSAPGVYDLGGRLELWCENELYSKPVLQNLQALGFLTIKNTNA